MDLQRHWPTNRFSFMLFNEIQRFLGEIKTDNLTVSNNENMTEITATTLTFRDRTTDITYCADVTLFLQVTSGGLSLTAFFLRPFFAFYCFKCYSGSFSSCKTAFSPNIIPPKHVKQDQIDAKWLGKKFIFWCESRRAGRSLIIVNKSIKETENFIFSV